MQDTAAADLIAPLDGALRPMFIAGKWVEARSGRTRTTANPANGEVLARVPEADVADVDEAVAAARRAFEGPWSKFKPYERQMLLLRIADLVERHFDEISLSDTLDMGTPITRTRGNRARVVGMLRFYAGQATAIHGQTISNSIPGSFLTHTVREPVGVVGAIIPWNAPMAATVWKVGPALATGCTVVLKPSEEAPLTPLLMARLMEEAGVPEGVVNVVTGDGATAGARLAEHPGVDKIAFTGSDRTGQAIVRASAVNMKRVTVELGGKSPNIVFADADLDKAVAGAAMAVFANSGQVCLAGSRLFVERSIHDEFVERVAAYAKGLRVGHGIDPATDLGPVVSRRQLDRVADYLDAGRNQGARLQTGGEPLKDGEFAKGHFVAPTVFSDVTDDMRIAREEIFGPVVSAMPFDDEEEVVRRANNTPFGLAAGIWTRDIGRAHRIAGALHAGTVWINAYHLLDPAVPFGGYKMSGYGREGGIEHLDSYLNTKSVWIDAAG